MKTKLLSLVILLNLVLGLFVQGSSVFAQDGQPPAPPYPTPFKPSLPASGEDIESSLTHGQASGMAGLLTGDGVSGQVSVGQPGLSFRYVKTFGETEVAYLANTTHLNFPYSVSTIGNSVWVGELWGNRVLKYTSSGAFQKAYGTPGFPDANDDTYFWEVADLEEDSAGSIWVVDTANQFISKIDNTGTRVFSLGTRWEQGEDNDHFMFPIGIAFDVAGNVYVSDGAPWWDESNGNHRIQIFQDDGTYLATIGETGVCDGDNAHLCGPAHIDVDGTLIYIADRANDRVQVYNISNPSIPVYITTLANDFDGPSGVAVDESYIYVADSYNNRVQIFNKTTYAYVATIGGDWGTGAYEFKYPTDVAVDSSGRLYVADFVNQRVQQYTRAGSVWNYSRTYGITGIPYLTDPYHYNRPSGVGIAADGSMYILEDYGHRLSKFNAAGTTLLWSVGVPGLKGDWTSNTNIFSNPADLAFDSSGKVYVADRWHGQVRMYNPSNGSHLASIDINGCPGGITISNADFLYVADPCDHTVKIYNPAYQLVAVMGVSGEAGNDNGHFRDLEDVAVDSDGKIYVADSGNARVQVFNADRTYLRTLGETGVFGRDFGHFGWVNALVIDKAQRLYVADEWENRIQVYDQDGAYLTTIGGAWGERSGQMRNPAGVALDSAGNVYVADTYNHRIQKFAVGYPGWEQVNINGFGTMDNTRVGSLTTFQGQIYAGVGNDNGAQLLRSSDGVTWNIATDNGFGNVRNVDILSLFEFDGNLYAGTYTWDVVNNQIADGAQLWRSANGTTWVQVTMTGFDAANNSSIIELSSYNGKLYASTWNDGLQGGNIWVSDSGDSDTWTLITAGFGDTHNEAIMVMESFGTNLYAGTFNVNSGGEVWRSATGDDNSWIQVNTDGFGDSKNIGISSLVTLDGYLYASSSSWLGVGQKVWRCQSCDGNDWVQVLDVPGDGASNLYVQSGNLYATTGNIRDGMNVWVTTSGTTWHQIAFDGFGDPGNVQPSLFKSMAVFDNGLYIGTENMVNGGEIWRMRGAFSKVSPGNNATDVSLSPILSWQASSGATDYEYCYSSAPGPCTQWRSVGADTTVTLSGLAPDYTYYWQARAVNAGVSTEANGGDWWSFTTTSDSACTWPAYIQPTSPTFLDVPMTVGHWSWVERLSSSGITAGCGNGNFCPFNNVIRAQMAIFLLRSKHCGSAYTPPSVGDSTGFNDVPLTASYAPWVKQLAAEGITTGCGGGNFCPLQAVNRAQMAIFLLRARHGATYSPPAVGSDTGFGDVPLTVSYAPWVKQLAAEGITTGCGGGNFCPLQNVNRAQMATFLVRAFGLP